MKNRKIMIKRPIQKRKKKQRKNQREILNRIRKETNK